MRIRPGPARLGLPLLAFAATAGAHEIDLSFNDDAFRVSYATVLQGNLRLDAGWLSDDGGQEGDLVHGSFLVTGDAAPGRQKVTAGVGVRLAYLDGDGSDQDGYALGVGGSLRWIVPRYDRFTVSGEYFWAPDVLAGGDAEKYVDGTLRLNYSVTRQAEVFVGARYTGAEFEDQPSLHFDTGMHAGLTLRF